MTWRKFKKTLKVDWEKIKKSKTLQFNLIMTIVNVVLIIEPFVPRDFLPFTTVVQGIGTAIIRIWFTHQPISANSLAKATEEPVNPVMPQNEGMDSYSE